MRGAANLDGGYKGEVSDGAVASGEVDEVTARCDLAGDRLEVVTWLGLGLGSGLGSG